MLGLLRRRLLLLGILSVACNEYSPTSPTAPRVQLPTPNPPRQERGEISVWIYEADSDGRCVVPAQVEIIAGSRAGTVFQQTSEGCNDGGQGMILSALEPDSIVRLKASAPGYVSEERDVRAGGPSQETVGPPQAGFELRRAQQP